MGCVIELVKLFMVDAELMKILFIFPFHYIMFENIASSKKKLVCIRKSVTTFHLFRNIYERNIRPFNIYQFYKIMI